MIELIGTEIYKFMKRWKDGKSLPRGVFYYFDKKIKKYMCIDNREDKCWWDEFNSLSECQKWIGDRPLKATNDHARL